MSRTGQDLNALLGARICHDLISPLGAIGNGMELLGMSGLPESPEMAMIRDSVENANARIRFFRVAFGTASADQDIGRTEVLSILAPLWANSRLNVDWQIAGPVPRAQAKLAFLLIQCLETAMPWGGTITVALEAGDWTITGAHERLKPRPALWDILTRRADTTDVAAAEVHFPLAANAAALMGIRLQAEVGERQIVLTF